MRRKTKTHPNHLMLFTRLFCTISLCSGIWTCVSAQNDTPHITTYHSDGTVSQGNLKGKLFKRPEIKLETEGEVQRIQTRKLDSLILDGQTYTVRKNFLDADLLLELDTGLVDLYEVNNSFLGIRWKGRKLMLVSPRDFDKVLPSFGYGEFEKGKDITREEFVSSIKKINRNTTRETILPIDSIAQNSDFFIPRISFLRPEVGFELNISRVVSLYNSIGLNFFGDASREAQTFVNYDYSGELRLFYNQERRLEKGKLNYNRTGPFIAGSYKYFIDINRENTDFVGILHGWQESNLFSNGTFVGFRLGAGYDMTNEGFMFFSALTMGWTFK